MQYVPAVHAGNKSHAIDIVEKYFSSLWEQISVLLFVKNYI